MKKNKSQKKSRCIWPNIVCFFLQHKNGATTVFINLAALVSMFGVIISIKPDAGLTRLRITFIIISFLLFIIATVIEFFSARKRYIYFKDDDAKWKEKVQNYMKNWIRKTDRVLVFSRDLSWVNEDIKQLLTAKARRNDLTICLPKHTDLTKELQNNNASIVTYSSLNYSLPKSRFTIAGYGKAGASVAIAHNSSKYHIIEECSANDHPAFSMAEDLVEVLKRWNANSGQIKS